MTLEAVDKGIFGSPSMLISGLSSSNDGDEELWFGSDRFEQLAHFAKLPWHGPDPRGISSKL